MSKLTGGGTFSMPIICALMAMSLMTRKSPQSKSMRSLQCSMPNSMTEFSIYAVAKAATCRNLRSEGLRT